MKTKCLLISLAILFSLSGFAQTTLVLQPGSADGKESNISYCVPCGYNNANDGIQNELDCNAWTSSGSTTLERGLIQFDLSTIPVNATISGATLSLYWNPNPQSGNAGQSSLNGSDAAWLQRVTSNWDPSIITWNNQPTTTTQDEVTIPESVSDTESYPNIDVTSLVQDMVDSPATSFGFMLLLQNENPYRALVFCSSNYSDSTKHPKLVITYNLQGLSTTSSQTNISCHGKTDGTAKISIAHGTPPFTFSWLPNVSNDSIATGLSPGNYLVSVSDSGGVNSENIFFIITQPAVLTLTPSGTNPVCTNNNGIAKVTPIGGTAPYSYLWSNNSTSQILTGLLAGIYPVTVTDKNGCNASGADTLVTKFSTLSLNKSRTYPPCGVASGSAGVNPGGGAAPYSYLWSNNSTAQNITSIAAGTYSVTVTDHNGCVVSDTVIVQSAAIPSDSVPSICMVTVDSLSQYNVIMWDNSYYYSQAVDSFIIYREITSNNYLPIGAVSSNALSIFVDTVRTLYFPNTGNPNAGTYRYKIGVKDVCGNYSAKSPWQNTLYIINNNGVFTWPYPYAIENDSNPVIAYILYRNDNGIGSWHAINSVAGTQQFVTDPDYNTYKNTAAWCVATQWDISCTPTLRIAQTTGISYNSSRSNSQGVNIATNVNNLSNENIYTIYPNPATNQLSIHYSSISKEPVTISLMNVLGQEAPPSELFIKGQENAIIDISKLSAGMYFLQMKFESGIVAKRFVKE